MNDILQMNRMNHLHARDHHRAECRCDDCSWNGCRDDLPCDVCVANARTRSRLNAETIIGRMVENVRR